jgi:hypothetical protein
VGDDEDVLDCVEHAGHAEAWLEVSVDDAVVPPLAWTRQV